MKMEYVTPIEINILGIQRTGQHGIISWTLGHFDKVYFKNHVDHIKGVIPPYWYFEPKKKAGWDVIEDRFFPEPQDAVVLGSEFTNTLKDYNPIIPLQKEYIACARDKDEFAEKEYHLLVIRNPYNHFASVLKWHRNKVLRNHINFKKCWISFAKEYLKETNIIESPNKRFVIYDQWFSDEEYRRGISEFLGLEFSDLRLNTVMKIGIDSKFGSSFDKMKYNKKAQDMDVLNRWKALVGHEEFDAIYHDDEIKELAEAIGLERPE